MSWVNIIFIVYQIIAILAVIHVIMDNRQPAKTMAWALVIWFVPVVGIVFYLFFGVNTRKERMVSQRSLDQLTKRSMLGFVEQQDLHLPEQHKPLINLYINQNFSLPFKDNHVQLLSDGGEFFEAKRSYAKDMVTGFIRMNGATVGVVGNRTALFDENGKETEKFDAVLSAKGAEKAADFVKFCDAFDIPLVSVTNVKGFKSCMCNEKRPIACNDVGHNGTPDKFGCFLRHGESDGLIDFHILLIPLS